MAKIDRLTKRLLMIYGQGRVALNSERFQIWGTDIDRVEFVQLPTVKPGLTVTGLAESFKVHGEVGGDWCEMVEVAWWCNQDRDGCIYFVGNEASGSILKPSWREMKGMAEYQRKFPGSQMTTEALMAWSLMVGGDWYDQLTY